MRRIRFVLSLLFIDFLEFHRYVSVWLSVLIKKLFTYILNPIVFFMHFHFEMTVCFLSFSRAFASDLMVLFEDCVMYIEGHSIFDSLCGGAASNDSDAPPPLWHFSKFQLQGQGVIQDACPVGIPVICFCRFSLTCIFCKC